MALDSTMEPILRHIPKLSKRRGFDWRNHSPDSPSFWTTLSRYFYRGDKRCHFISSQIVVDTNGLIVLLVTGCSINHLLWPKPFFCMDNHHYCTSQVSRTWMMPNATGVFLRLDMQSQRFAPSSTHSGWRRLRCEGACYNSQTCRAKS